MCVCVCVCTAYTTNCGLGPSCLCPPRQSSVKVRSHILDKSHPWTLLLLTGWWWRWFGQLITKFLAATMRLLYLALYYNGSWLKICCSTTYNTGNINYCCFLTVNLPQCKCWASCRSLHNMNKQYLNLAISRIISRFFASNWLMSSLWARDVSRLKLPSEGARPW